jgi:hypothetical protein
MRQKSVIRANAKNCCCLRCQRKCKFGSNTNSLSKISPYKYLRNCASIHKMTYELLTIIITIVVPYIDTNLGFLGKCFVVKTSLL